MTSFHDILGTDEKTTSADVKRRYKLLSSRLHPDKGGSKALMQMIVQAYEKVNLGKGYEEAVRTIQLKDILAEGEKAKLKQLERDFIALKKLNEQLNQKFKEEQERNKQSSEKSERYTNAAEDELKWLRRENRRLTKQLDEARWKLSDTTRAVVPVSATSGSSLSTSLGDISPKVQSQIKALGHVNFRRFALMLLMPIIIAGLLFSLGKEPWLALLNIFEEPQKKPEARVTILETNPDDEQTSFSHVEAQSTSVIQEKPQPQPRIKLENIAGLWQLRYFGNTQQPYISVRSDKGSYVVKSCDNGFQYYKNSNLRAGRLAANLIFDRRDRHFMIYNIPYGNGSFAANWSESKSLLINKEYFPNDGFSEAYYQLQQVCPY
ncbi:molecular chaperone DnaJ [uncultured Photobacterium sp.]|uniref:molecular chaperone DnaJ n=1 Tax=uncultured Photobacterium sp. TaxID=173973 RepID=UPI00262831CC|nr:molecular chaperone DnaJ [uncultured Photobacterium sp.]